MNMETEATAVVSADPRSKAKHGRNAGKHGKEEAVERMSDDTVAGLFLLSVVFAALAAWALCRAGGDPPVAVVWRLSLLVCGCLAFWIGALSGAGARAVLFRVSYAVLAAFAMANRLSAGAGMAAIFVVALVVAAFFGYYLAVDMHGVNATTSTKRRKAD